MKGKTSSSAIIEPRKNKNIKTFEKYEILSKFREISARFNVPNIPYMNPVPKRYNDAPIEVIIKYFKEPFIESFLFLIEISIMFEMEKISIKTKRLKISPVNKIPVKDAR